MTEKARMRSKALALLTAYVAVRWLAWGFMALTLYRLEPETAREMASLLGLGFAEVYALLALGYLSREGPAWAPTRTALGAALTGGILLAPLWLEAKSALPVDALLIWGLYLAFRTAR